MLTRCAAPQNAVGSQALDVTPTKGLHSFKIWSVGNFQCSTWCKGDLMWQVISAPRDLHTERHLGGKKSLG